MLPVQPELLCLSLHQTQDKSVFYGPWTLVMSLDRAALKQVWEEKIYYFVSVSLTELVNV